MTEANKATVCVYLQDNQSPAEKRFSLNLMINMLSQTKNSNGDILLDATVNHIAEFLIITKGTKLPNVKQFIEMLRLYPHGDIPDNTKRQMIAKLSDGIFDESPAKGRSSSSKPKLTTPSSRQRFAEQSDGSGTDSDQEVQQARSGREIQVKAPTDDEITDLMEELMRTSTRPTVRDKEREEEQMEKYKIALGKLDKVAIFLYLVKPKESVEKQGRALSSIFQVIDVKTHSLIEFPMTSDTDSPSQTQSLQGSMALACLIKRIYGQDHGSIKRQLQQIQVHATQLSSARDLTKFKREHQGEIAIYEKLWMFYSSPVDKRDTEHEFCEMLLKEVAKTSLELAKQLRKQLEATESPLTMEELLVRLEENERLMESLEVESTAASKGGAAKTSDKKGKQSIANPAIQQQPKCTSCGSEHDVSQCPKRESMIAERSQAAG